jgi:hypothetical protein
MRRSHAKSLRNQTLNAIVGTKLAPNCALVAMCDVVTAKFGVGGGVGDLLQGLTHIQKRLGDLVTPLGGDADLERLRDPEDSEFDGFELRDAMAEAPPGHENTQMCVIPDRASGAVHPLAVQWLVRFPLPIMRDFTRHII